MEPTRVERPTDSRRRRGARAALALVAVLVAAACGVSGGPAPAEERVLTISAIPDQDPQLLQRLYGDLSTYLTEQLDVRVRYEPVLDYTAAVTAFRRGDLDAVFFGGLTGVQARLLVPGSVTLAQRDVDETFRSVFVAGAATGLAPLSDVSGLAALAGRSVTFGSEVSTSGRLMPQFFLAEAGVGTEDLAGAPGFSGSHDATIALVEAGSYEVGALNASVWDARVADGSVDPAAVVEIFRTPTYHDYHWLGRPDLDERLGAGFTERLRTTLLGLDGSDRRESAILELFTAGSFVPTTPENYTDIEDIARELGLVR